MSFYAARLAGGYRELGNTSPGHCLLRDGATARARRTLLADVLARWPRRCGGGCSASKAIRPPAYQIMSNSGQV